MNHIKNICLYVSILTTVLILMAYHDGEDAAWFVHIGWNLSTTYYFILDERIHNKK